MNRTPGRLVVAVLACLALVAAAPGFAVNDQVDAGLDTWYTPSGGAQITTTIPAGAFCNGTSNTLTRTIKLKGVPLTTSPTLTNVDTIIERLGVAVFDSNGEASTTLQILALSLESITDVTVTCTNTSPYYQEVWEAEVSLAPTQASGTIDFVKTSSTGGTFSASFPVNGSILYTKAGTSVTAGPYTDLQPVTTASSPFTFAPPTGAQPTNGPVWIDLDDDGIAEYNTGLPTGPNFWPNGPVDHDGPHPDTCIAPGNGCPEWEPPTCDEPVVVTALKDAAVKGVGFVFDNEATAREQEIGKVVVSQVDQATLQRKVRDICVSVAGAQYLR